MKFIKEKVKYAIRKNIDIVDNVIISSYSGIIYKEYYILGIHVYTKNLYVLEDTSFDNVYYDLLKNIKKYR